MAAKIDIVKNIQEVLSRIVSVHSQLQKDTMLPRLVAVSKTKPPEDIIEAYNAGQRVFGENYTQELTEKGNSPQILEHCKEIQWHFIGHLQRNKVKKLLKTPRLTVIETVDSLALADELQKHWQKLNSDHQLRVFIQVNTSGEEQKSGCATEDDVIALVRHVKENCPCLSVSGIMTIGAYDYNSEVSGPNPDFLRLAACRRRVCEEFGWKEDELELSMGMSSDFEHAISLGSTNVRIGSTIFGARDPKP